MTGDVLWSGDLSSLEDCRALARIVGEHRNRVRSRVVLGDARSRRIAAGLCRECGEKPLINASHCAECRELHNECNRNWLRQRGVNKGEGWGE